jgi:hypothetical protein
LVEMTLAPGGGSPRDKVSLAIRELYSSVAVCSQSVALGEARASSIVAASVMVLSATLMLLTAIAQRLLIL